MKFVRAASELDNVRLLGLVHTPPKGPDINRFADIVRMTNPLDKQDIFDGVSLLKKRHGHIDRIICILEALMVPVAEARAKFDVQHAMLHARENRSRGVQWRQGGLIREYFYCICTCGDVL